MNIFLKESQISKIIPYYLIVDRDLKIIACSNNIKLFVPNVLLNDFNIIFEFSVLGLQLNTYEYISECTLLPIEIICKSKDHLVFSGDIEIVNDAEDLLFILKPIDFENKVGYLSNNQNEKEQQSNKYFIKSIGNLYKLPYVLYKIGNAALNDKKPIAVLNKEGFFEWTNYSYTHIFGWELDELKGKSPNEILFGEESLRFPKNYFVERTLEKQPYSFNNIVYTKNGDKIWFNANVLPIIDDYGNVCGRYTIFEETCILDNDNSKLPTYEENLKLEKLNYLECKWTFEVKNNILKLSREIHLLLGYSPKKHNHETTHYTEFKTKMLNGILVTLQRSIPSFIYTHNILCENNKMGTFVIIGKVKKWDSSESPILLEGTIIEFNKYMENINNLTYMASLLSSVISSINEGIMFEDANNKIIFANKVFCKFISLDLEPKAIIGNISIESIRSIKWLFVEPEVFKDRVLELLQNKEQISDEIVYMLNGTILKRDFIPIFHKNVLNGYMWKYSDITKKIELENELGKQKERLLNLIKNLNEAVLLEDENRKILLTNNMFCNMFSIPISPEQLIGADCTESAEQTKYLFKNPEQFVNSIKNILQNKTIVTDEKIELLTGQVFSRDYTPIFLDHNYYGHLWKYKDVTEQQIYEKQLFDQRQYYHNILNEIPSSIIIYNTENEIVFLNKNACEDEYTNSWIVGKSIYDYYKVMNYEAINIPIQISRIQKAINTRITLSFTDEIIKTNGTKKYILTTYYPLLVGNLKVNNVIVYEIDITEQIRDRIFSEVQEKRIRNLLEIITDGVFRCYADGTVNLFNNAFIKILNVNIESPAQGYFELVNIDDIKEYVPEMNVHNIPYTINFFGLLYLDSLNIVKAKIDALYDTGKPQFGIFEIKNNDGGIRYIEFTFTLAIRAIDAAFVGRLTDITAEVEKENSYRDLIKKEQALNQSKSRFINITSHELRTPLSIIQANSEILDMINEADSPLKNKYNQFEITERIRKEILHMTEILNQLMMVSRIESGTVEFNLEAVDIVNLVENLKTDYYSPYTDGRVLKIKTELTNRIFEVDKKLIRHAIINLLNNAFKYSQTKQEPIITIEVNEFSNIIKVQDFGIGIPEEDISKLISSFFRASNVSNIQGTGIGLTVVEYAIKKHNGHIEIYSELNKGTIFTITIPKKK